MQFYNASTKNPMADCFLTVLKMHIDDVLKQNTLYIILYSDIMKHDNLFQHKAINIFIKILFIYLLQYN